MNRFPFILTLLGSILVGCSSTPQRTPAQEEALSTRLFKHLCNGNQQRRKMEVSWVSTPSSQVGQRLDIAQENTVAELKLFQAQALHKFADLPNSYYDQGAEDFLSGKEYDVTNLAGYMANEFVLMIPQNLHADVFAEECLPHYGNSSRLGYRDGQPVLSALLDHRNTIWSCYALKNTEVLQSGSKFTSRLDLGGFCKYARPADSFLAK